MLSKFSSSRSLKDNIQLGVLTAFSAGMVNIASLIIFFAFTSNVTGHYAILAEEIAKGNWFQVVVVFTWIFMFFFGNFTSNLIVINFNEKHTYLAHSVPIFLEMCSLLVVGFYGVYFYQETLKETELLVALLLFAMGLQNGLTASISNFAVKTTHLTGATTDLGVITAMLTQKRYRQNQELRGKYRLIWAIAISYLTGGVVSGLIYFTIGFAVFFVVCITLLVVVFYDFSKLKINKYMKSKRKL